MVKVFFENIKQEISEIISKAQNSIWIATAFFTDNELFEMLCVSASKNIDVQLLISDDPSNFMNSKVNFIKLVENGGKFFLANRTNNGALMHHKFCIIDNRILINGSYNWTIRAAKNNIENIMLIDDQSCVNTYKNEFIRINSNFCSEVRDNRAPIPSGFLDLDRITNGFLPGELILITGRHGMGYDHFVQCIALNCSVDFRIPTYYISTQYPYREAYKRILAILNGKSVSDTINDESINKVLSEAPLTVCDEPNISINMIEKVCNRFSLERGLIILNDITNSLINLNYSSFDFNSSVKTLNQLKATARENRLAIIIVAELPIPKLHNEQKNKPDITELNFFTGLFDSIFFIHDAEYNSYASSLKQVSIERHFGVAKGNFYLRHDTSTHNFLNLEDGIMEPNLSPSNLIKLPQRFNDDEDIPF